jgi:hypothetical protein
VYAVGLRELQIDIGKMGLAMSAVMAVEVGRETTQQTGCEFNLPTPLPFDLIRLREPDAVFSLESSACPVNKRPNFFRLRERNSRGNLKVNSYIPPVARHSPAPGALDRARSGSHESRRGNSSSIKEFNDRAAHAVAEAKIVRIDHNSDRCHHLDI